MPHDIAKEIEKIADDLGIDRRRSIGEIAKELKVETHIIRFWEGKFPQIKPEIGAGKRRYYYNKQLKIIKRIKKFLYEDGYTISGLQKLLKKRKPDSYKEEDLDIIANAVSADDLTSKNTRDLDDFINSDVMIETDLEAISLDKSSKIEVEKLLIRTNQNLAKLKTILQKSIL